ncbi:HYD1 signature containing ADP-ribosyltransferase family protein [Streptomyces sp. NPDC058855]|uniref:HYD1 signature containing ADP-ribosyltransferase family protein n=1 Tax=Streptomyces sp. NPDC058855 TaxID=3346651 RepID=UPI0036A37196
MAVSLIPTEAMAAPPPDDPQPHAVELPALQQTEEAAKDEAKAEQLSNWSGTPAEPPAEYIPNEATVPAPDAGAANLSQAAGQLVPVEDLPVKIGQASPSEAEPAPPAPTGTWNVEVESQATSEAVGVDGTLLTVTPPAGGSTPVDVQLDYSKFADLYGTEWASRMKLVQLPECFLSTPELPECSTPTDVPSVNDPATGTVTATVDPADTPVQGLSAQAGGGTTVLVPVDSGAGGAGSFKASSLSPTGSWTAGGSGGGFSWSYPLAVPAPAAGPAPKIDFSYSSQAVDGKTSVANGQASWIGDGWDYHPGFVERRYRTCSDDRKNAPNNENDKKKSDLCWASDNLVLSMGGTTTELVHDADGRWVAANDDGTKIEYLDRNGAAKAEGKQTGEYAGEYWRLTTRDGTKYHFGRDDLDGAGTRALTRSVFTVDVAGNHSGEPCHQATFAASLCKQAWRWNLDYVEDVHGNAMVIDWFPEANRYGQNGDHKNVKDYIRGGYPTQILYGLRSDNLTGPPAGRVEFIVHERCEKQGPVACVLSEFESKNYADKQPWWDTPATLHCKFKATTCYVTAPTFWTKGRLVAVNTYGQRTPNSTALSKVDSWTLKQDFPEDRFDSHPPLWLDSITRTGYGADGSATPMPPVAFEANEVDMPNRVLSSAQDKTPDFDRLRVETIRTETGGEIKVDYSAPCAVGAARPAPKDNTSRCFPVHWSVDPDDDTPGIEWFNKYVVESVSERDRAAHGLDVVTAYTYKNSEGKDEAAWAKETDEFSKSEHRTYSQWRGYAEVTVTRGATQNVGAPTETQKSKTVTRYFQGMSKEKSAEPVFVTASGGELLGEDLSVYQGRAAETITYTAADNGAVHARELSWPTTKQIAKRVRGDGLPDLTAHRTRTVKTETIQALSGGKTRKSRTETTYDDAYGLPTTVHNTTVGPDGGLTDETCTTTQYVHNTVDHVIGLPAHELTIAGGCVTTPPATDRIVSATRTSYDAFDSFGNAPTKGLPRQVDTIEADGTGWITSVRTDYDALGRVIKALDAKNNATTTTYKPATGPAFETTVTNAATHSTTSSVDPGRGSVLSVTDPNGRKTTSAYDGLGRVIKVWSPSRSTAGSPSAEFVYQIADNKVPAVVTKTLRDNGTYATSVVLYDGLLRPRQTQTEAMGGGRLVTDTLYNAAGSVSETTSAYLAKGEPETKIFPPVTVFDIPASTKTAYDGLGRPTKVTTLKNDVAHHTTTTQYGDTWTLTRTGMSANGATPLSGSRAVKTTADALGRTTEVKHFTTTDLGQANPAGLVTTYAYDVRGNLSKVTDAEGNAWTYAYDTRGRLVASTDPDIGKASFGYDELDRKTWTEDTLGRTQHTLYDVLGRATELREDSTSGPLISKWTYDSLPGAKGLAVSSVQYHQGAPYTSEVTGYDTEYRPTGTKITIPSTVDTAGIDGTYAYGYTYSPTGKLLKTSLPATPAGLNAEQLVTRYNADGAPITTSGHAWYTSGTYYSPYGQVLRTTSGQSPKRVWTSNIYDDFTGRLTSTESQRESTIPNAHISTVSYGYDTVGNITSISDLQTTVTTTNGQTSKTLATDRQCFAYDPMGRLVHAWTGNAGCPTTASTTSQVAGPSLSQLSPGTNGGGYWHSYEFDAIGNRTKLTVHDLADPALDDTHTYTYGRTDANNGTQPLATTQPHTLARIDSTTKAPGSVVTATSAHSVDALGNTTARVIGGDSQSLTWDRRNKLTSVTGFGNGKGPLVNPSGKCLDLQSGNTTPGTPIQLHTCNNTGPQQWKLTEGTLRVLTKCAAVAGTQLVVENCDGSPEQKFTHRPADDSLHNAATNTCVAVPNAEYTDGKDLTLAPCTQQNSQKWRLGDATSYVYDASGNRLIETTATSRTLYLPDAQVTVTTTGTPLRAERYYSHPGAPTTVRTALGSAHKLNLLLTDHHGTPTTSVQQTDEHQTVTRRAFDPFGNPRGTEPTAWPGRQSFVGTGVDDPTTGLTHIGAREYDATTGRFLSADPLIDLTDPLQMNGYAYANNSPVTLSDPTGLRPMITGGNARDEDAFLKKTNTVFVVNSGGKFAPAKSSYRYKERPAVNETTYLKYGEGSAPLPKVTKGRERYLKSYHKTLKSYGYSPDSWRSNESWQKLNAHWSACHQDGVECSDDLHNERYTDLSESLALGGGRGSSAKLKKPKPRGDMEGDCNSFTSEARVVLADGTTRAIKDLEPGDKVLATDEETGETVAKDVTATIEGEGEKRLVRVVVDADGSQGDRTTSLTATEGHPFWVPDLHEWVEAKDLKAGQWLHTSAGTKVQVTAVRAWTQNASVRNLTVADFHTYYVLAGKTPVLVHNSGGCPPETLIHYTDEAGMNGIVGSRKLNASTKEASPKDAYYGDGQYLSDISPGTKRCAQLSRCFLGHPFSGRRFTNYVEIDVRGLNVVKGRDNVYVIPNQGPLDLNGRIVGYGAN